MTPRKRTTPRKPAAPKGEQVCGFCGQSVATNADGAIVAHAPDPDGDPERRCPGGES